MSALLTPSPNTYGQLVFGSIIAVELSIYEITLNLGLTVEINRELHGGFLEVYTKGSYIIMNANQSDA